jgi:hypothetical protein
VCWADLRWHTRGKHRVRRRRQKRRSMQRRRLRHAWQSLHIEISTPSLKRNAIEGLHGGSSMRVFIFANDREGLHGVFGGNSESLEPDEKLFHRGSSFRTFRNNLDRRAPSCGQRAPSCGRRAPSALWRACRPCWAHNPKRLECTFSKACMLHG